MEENKFSKGIWLPVEYDGVIAVAASVRKTDRPTTMERRNVALLHENQYISREEAIANANLIAIAPGMLCVIEAIKDYYDRGILKIESQYGAVDRDLSYRINFCVSEAHRKTVLAIKDEGDDDDNN